MHRQGEECIGEGEQEGHRGTAGQNAQRMPSLLAISGGREREKDRALTALDSSCHCVSHSSNV
jgi:hypothetical protein